MVVVTRKRAITFETLALGLLLVMLALAKYVPSSGGTGGSTGRSVLAPTVTNALQDCAYFAVALYLLWLSGDRFEDLGVPLKKWWRLDVKPLLLLLVALAPLFYLLQASLDSVRRLASVYGPGGMPHEPYWPVIAVVHALSNAALAGALMTILFGSVYNRIQELSGKWVFAAAGSVLLYVAYEARFYSVFWIPEVCWSLLQGVCFAVAFRLNRSIWPLIIVFWAFRYALYIVPILYERTL